MEFWLDIAAFALKTLLLVGAIGGAIVAIIAATRQKTPRELPAIRFASLDERYERAEDAFRALALGRKERKALARQRKRERKAAPDESRARIFVLAFKGDLGATAVRRLAAEITAVLCVARPGVDEIVARIQSPGGAVTGYGQAAAEIARARDQGVAVTACVDQVAASGGYMMACAANRIVAAPFAIVGSIGVVAPVPNLNRLLRQHNVDYEEIAAGEHKRSVSLFGEITSEGRAHFREKIDAMHVAFRNFVAARRPGLDIEAVGNGDHWLASEGKALGLVDELMTSEDYLLRRRTEARLIEVTSEEKTTPLSLLRRLFGADGEGGLSALWRGAR